MRHFDFDRSLVLGSVTKDADGLLVIKTAFHGSAILPKSSVRLVTTRHLNDTSVRVVDFGKLRKGQQPTTAIIAAGRKDRLPLL